MEGCYPAIIEKDIWLVVQEMITRYGPKCLTSREEYPFKRKLSITADPRSDGLVKARTGDTTDAATYSGWYNAVYVPSGTAVQGNG